MNILTNDFKILNDKLLKKNIEVKHDNYSISINDDIYISDWNSFGIHFVPNILFKLYNSLNIFDFNITFNYKISDEDNIKIYNGIKWIVFDKCKTKNGKFDEILNFDFTKNYWRISTKNIQKNIVISNLRLAIKENQNYLNFKKKKSLLIIGGTLKISKDFDNDDKKLINCFSNNYLFYLKKYLIEKYNFTVYNIPLSENDVNLKYLENLLNFNYCIDINQMGITKKGKLFHEKLKNNILGGIYSIYDNGIKISKNNLTILENNIFCAIPDFNEIIVKYISWAADETIFFPEQNLDKKIILIDDCHYNFERNDSYVILDFCISLLSRYNNLEIIRFGFYDNVINFNDKYKNNMDRYTVIENKIAITEKAKIHNKSWIFFCTHYETLGIPNIESAMAGCLLIYKNNFVNKSLTKNLLKIEYNDISELDNIDIFSQVNFENQRIEALNYTWEKLVDNVYNNL
jgi:hypothetical protein